MPVLFKINNIEVRKDKYAEHGVSVTVINPISGQGVGMHIRHVTPDDLRSLADYLEESAEHMESPERQN